MNVIKEMSQMMAETIQHVRIEREDAEKLKKAIAECDGRIRALRESTDFRPRPTAYLAGPMTGHKDYNFPAFEVYSKAIRELGFMLVSPHENFGGRIDLPYEVYLRKCFQQILSLPHDTGRLFFMPGWETSNGARSEFYLAHQLKLPCFEIYVELNAGVWNLDRVSFARIGTDLTPEIRITEGKSDNT